MWFAFDGSTTISLIARPRNASPEFVHEYVVLLTHESASLLQLSPPLVVL